MNAIKAEKIVYNLLLSDNSLPVRVRSKLSWHENEFNELLHAIDVLTEEWTERESVPKFVALAFVDIYGAFSMKEGFYPKEKQIFLENMAISLQEKASDLFS